MTAHRFAAKGAQVYPTGRRKSVVGDAVAEINGDVNEFVGAVADLAGSQ